MPDIARSALYGKLNSIGYKSLEGAATFCKLRGNPYVELVHWLHQLMQTQDSDLHRIIKAFNLDVSQLVADTQAALSEAELRYCQQRSFATATTRAPLPSCANTA
jgi:type VI secretion system protein VasG